MAWIIDEGLVEDCLDKTFKISDFEEIPIIDLDDIDATIEDPGYMLDEPLDTRKETEEYTSSYGKGSFTLPAQFFDIDRNIRLLKKCRPISINIVDCNMYPWYYKKSNYQTTKDTEHTKDEDKKKLSIALAEFLTFNCNEASKKATSAIKYSHSLEMKLSSEQSLSNANKKDEIDTNINKLNEAYYYKGNTDNAKAAGDKHSYLLPELDKNIPKYELDKTTDVIDPNHLLSYEAIAQTIVRNLDYSEVNRVNEDVPIYNKNSKTKSISVDTCDDVELVGVMENCDCGGKERDGKSSKNIIASPILPCTIRPKKKRKENLNKTSTASNAIFKKCCDSNKSCHKLISAEKVIPHYHYTLPNSKSTNNCFSNTLDYMSDNPMSSYITRDTFHHHLQQNEIFNRLQLKQHVNKYDYPPRTPEPPAYDSIMNLGTYVNPVAFTSRLDYNPLISNNTLLENVPLPPALSSSANVKKSNVLRNNINSIAHIQYPPSTPQLNYLDTFHYQNNSRPVTGYPNQINTIDDTINLNNVRAPDVTKENYRVFSQDSPVGYSSSCTPNSFYPSNDYVSTNKLQNPLQMTVAYHNRKDHPLLKKLLRHKRTSLITYPENNITTYTSIPNTYRISSGPSKSMIETFNKIKLEVMASMLTQKKCDGSNLRANGSGSVIKNPEPKEILNKYHNYNKIKNNRSMKKLQPTKHDFEINIGNSKQVPGKISNYSPPILPIPTLKEGLEILSKLPCTSVNANDDDCLPKMYTTPHTNKQRSQSNEVANMKRKRNDNEKINMKSRKISLQEYKQRKLDTGKKADAFVNSKEEHTTKMRDEDSKTHCHVGGVNRDIWTWM